MTPNIRYSLALVVLLAFLWGSGYAFTKLVVETLPPVTVSALRGLIGGLVLLAVLGRRTPLLWSAGIGGRVYFVQALFNCILPWILVAWASRIIDAGLATILNSLSPIFIFAITWGITRHEPATGRKFVGVSLGLAGVLAIIGMNALAGVGKHTVAELACVVGAICYAIAGVMGRRFATVSPMVPAAGATLMSAAVLVPLALLVEGWPAAPSMRSLLGVLALGFLSTGLAFVVYFRLIATIGAIAMSSQAYLRIVIGVAVGVVFLGETPTLSMGVGLVLVVAGIVAMTLPARRRETG
ncbi:MAG TPA: DMT family transporter [Usitatibacter sp.]|nr:DMT family transporter [Usitatibacter sp.]